jgi:hypothetical protein
VWAVGWATRVRAARAARLGGSKAMRWGGARPRVPRPDRVPAPAWA